eukprot:TRINITY_DN7554_c1_g1_i1.p1 TRINITY_DN7554_c1_g1~~TRINITY_DN7554_c1_g1_i1.p1  ORF type:complete len:459 (+),score=103.36 TRINITY_DN7554_c1_g1_i1:39-1379(+)
MCESTIKSGDWGLAVLADDKRFMIKIQKGEQLKGKKIPACDLGDLIGLKWNQKIDFDAKEKKLVLGKEDESEETVAKLVEEGCGGGQDNRKLLDNNSAQTADPEQLLQMRISGSGEEAIKELITSSKTFMSKTKFAQEKYIKKKQKKYVFQMRVFKPTISRIIEMSLLKKPEKIMHLRVDTMGEILTFANIHAGSSTMVLDSTAGLVTAACVQRMGGQGKLYNIVGTQGKGAPTMMNCEYLGINDWAEKTMVNVDLDRDLCELPNNEECTKLSSKNMIRRDYRSLLGLTSAAHEIQQIGGIQSVVIASSHDPQEAFFELLPLMGGSCTFAVYSRYIEPLVALSSEIRNKWIAVNVRLTETWWREHQVLPNKTHPFVAMSGTGGFVLSGTIVENNHPRSYWNVIKGMQFDAFFARQLEKEAERDALQKQKQSLDTEGQEGTKRQKSE